MPRLQKRVTLLTRGPTLASVELAGETGAAAQFVLGNRVGSGRAVPGLLTRREAEARARFAATIQAFREQLQAVCEHLQAAAQ